jgi:crotonobetainyl-CoA:carnitine CoA-transferase CaiB-like acyl-CoA transferase
MDVDINGVARGPLAGIRVLDLSTVVSGPLCTQILGDLGAEVVKIETVRGDSTRMMGPPFQAGLTPLFAQVNRNKRSIAIDLKQADGQAIVQRLARDTDVVVENCWKTADGHVAIVTIEDHQFQAFCRVVGREDLAQDERYANLFQRIMHAEELFRLIETELRKWPTAELVERAHQLGAPLAQVYGVAEMLNDPQVAANRTVFETEEPTAGRMRLLRNPVRFHGAPASLRRFPPRLGEHTDAVLREAGYGDEEVLALRNRGVVG